MKKIPRQRFPILLFAAFLGFTLNGDELSRIGGFVGGAARAPRSEPPKPAKVEHPFRKAGGRYWNVSPLYLNAPNVRVNFPGWQPIFGTVAQNTSGGILVDRKYSTVEGRVFVRNYPTAVPDGSKIMLWAIEDGVKQYESVTGANTTVAQFDYGIPYDPFAKTNSVSGATNKAAARSKK